MNTEYIKEKKAYEKYIKTPYMHVILILRCFIIYCMSQ